MEGDAFITLIEKSVGDDETRAQPPVLILTRDDGCKIHSKQCQKCIMVGGSGLGLARAEIRHLCDDGTTEYRPQAKRGVLVVSNSGVPSGYLS